MKRSKLTNQQTRKKERAKHVRKNIDVAISKTSDRKKKGEAKSQKSDRQKDKKQKQEGKQAKVRKLERRRGRGRNLMRLAASLKMDKPLSPRLSCLAGSKVHSPLQPSRDLGIRMIVVVRMMAQAVVKVIRRGDGGGVALHGRVWSRHKLSIVVFLMCLCK